MNDTPEEPTVYTFTAAIAEEGDDPEEIVTDPVEISVKVNFSNGGTFLKDKNEKDMVMRDVTLFSKENYTLADIIAEAKGLSH